MSANSQLSLGPPVVVAPDTGKCDTRLHERLDELDIKEREIFLERLELKSRWNRSLLATQLPNEILVLIFVYFSAGLPLTSTDGHDGDYFKFAPAKTQWPKVMLVCRHWCDVVRATPAFWRTIDVGKNKAWMQLALACSDGATVDVSFSSKFDEQDAAILEPHYHCLRSLRLRYWSPTALRVIPVANLHPLESLEITNHAKDRILHNTKYVITDRGITHERFPNLRILQVSHSDVPSDPLFYARLCKLSLKGCLIQSSLGHFIQLLSSSPTLRHLELEDFLQQLSDGGSVAGPLQVLPSLRSLRLGDHLPVYSARFLSRVVIPAASLSITADIDPDDEDSDSEEEEEEEEIGDDTLSSIVPPNLRRSLPRLTSVTRARLKVTFEDCAIECYATAREPDETPLVDLSLTSSTDSTSWEGDLSKGIIDFLALFDSAPLTHFKTVGYCELDAAGSQAWARLFQTFPSLVSLEADTSDMVVEGLLEASLASPTDGPVVCTGLESITLNDEWGCLLVDWMHVVFDPLPYGYYVYWSASFSQADEFEFLLTPDGLDPSLSQTMGTHRSPAHRTQMSSASLRLPPEITDAIIGFVWPDVEALCACSSVCRDWVNASRHHLFSSITLDFKRCDALMDQIILRPSSSIQPYLVQVHELILVGVRFTPRSESGFSVERTLGGGSLHTLVGQLPNLRILSFVACDFRHSVHPRIHMTLSRFSAVRVLELKNCAFPSFHTVRRMVTALASLEHLIMACPTWDAGPTSAQLVALDNRHNRPVLRSLDLSVANHGASIAQVLVEWLLGTRSRLSLQALKLFALDCPSNSPLWASYANVLKSFSSVSELRVCAFEHEGAATPLEHLTALEDLEITRFDRSLLQPIGWEVVCRILQQVCSPLRRLRFTIHRWNSEIDPSADRESVPPPSLNVEGLELLDPVLAHPKFHRLEVVHFAIEDTFAIGVIAPPTFSCASIVHDLQKCLPKLYARGIVRVSVATTAPLHPAVTRDLSTFFRAIVPGLPEPPSHRGAFDAFGQLPPLSHFVALKDLRIDLQDLETAGHQSEWEVVSRMLPTLRCSLLHLTFRIEKILDKPDAAPSRDGNGNTFMICLDDLELLQPVLAKEAFNTLEDVLFLVRPQYNEKPKERRMFLGEDVIFGIRAKIPQMYARGCMHVECIDPYP
ncbi:hypothetical protein GSI_13214 [Ganoderma sinense ZZ0214-1]|uniref:F-box domain-containing protein n=1 Tax=Ganoderma sinense ZZ0214-1 TaxID=1077348 RepID=A0A2G8RUY3_9APHY|nr:hypothetical protein GSI_13214 [Ganoderma sinense ZZ0214-1]